MSTYSRLGTPSIEGAVPDDNGALDMARRVPPSISELRQRLSGRLEVTAEASAGLLDADGKLQARLGPLQEALRRLAFELMPVTDGDVAPVWALTSANTGEGTTTVASILGCTVAADFGRQVLLIEGDLRRPALAGLLRSPETPGLSDVLAGKASLVDAMYETALPGLWVLAGGSPVNQPAPVLRNPVINDLLDAARNRFGAVVVDAPAVLASNETPLLASWADLSMLVVSSGRTALPDVRRAIDLLGGERETAVILNHVEPTLPAWLAQLMEDDGFR